MREDHASCVEACHACAIACNECAAACLQEDGVKRMARCIALDVDRAQACRACADACRRMAALA